MKNWIKTCQNGTNPFGDKDVIHFKWITDCIQDKKLLPLHPR